MRAIHGRDAERDRSVVLERTYLPHKYANQPCILLVIAVAGPLPRFSTMTSNPPPSSLICAVGSQDTVLSDNDIKSHLIPFLESVGPREDVLILPPDYTRLPSQAGKITRFISEYYNFISDYNDREAKDASEPETKRTKPAKSSSKPIITILPALGTHAPMTEAQIRSMFGDELADKKHPCSPFVVHDWRNDVVTIGHAPADMVSEATNGMVKQQWPAQLNKLVWEKRHHDPQTQPHKSLILSVGQVVPHEVMGMANFNKNLFVGVGGVEAINLSHFIGAVYGMERMMGKSSNPLRSILNYASEKYLQKELDLWYILTVMGTNKESGDLEMKGFFIGKDIECYTLACELSLQVNFTLVDRPLEKVVVYLDEGEFHSTWLGNKAIYRTRMAIADGGELIVLAPGVSKFGEDAEIDTLIREYGYVGMQNILKAMKGSPKLGKNLSAVAHLIHGSSEGRFSVTYCPGHLTKDEVEGVGFEYGDLKDMLKRYDRTRLKDGWNQVNFDGASDTCEEIFYISNPALGLWALRSRFEEEEAVDDPKDAVETDPISTSSVQNAARGSGEVGGWANPSSICE